MQTSVFQSRVPADYVGGIVPLALRASLCSLSAGVTIASLLGSIPFTLQISFHSFSANVIDSTYKLQYTLFLKLGSHYPPLRGIIRLTLQTSLRSFSASLIIIGSLRLLPEVAPFDI